MYLPNFPSSANVARRRRRRRRRPTNFAKPKAHIAGEQPADPSETSDMHATGEGGVRSYMYLKFRSDRLARSDAMSVLSTNGVARRNHQGPF